MAITKCSTYTEAPGSKALLANRGSFCCYLGLKFSIICLPNSHLTMHHRFCTDYFCKSVFLCHFFLGYYINKVGAKIHLPTVRPCCRRAEPQHRVWGWKSGLPDQDPHLQDQTRANPVVDHQHWPTSQQCQVSSSRTR